MSIQTETLSESSFYNDLVALTEGVELANNTRHSHRELEEEIAQMVPKEPEPETVSPLAAQTEHETERQLRRLVAGAAVAELLFLPYTRTMGKHRADAVIQQEAIHNVLQRQHLWRPGMDSIKTSRSNEIYSRFHFIGAGMLAGTGVLVLHKEVINIGESEKIYDTQLHQWVEGVEQYYIGFRADATTNDLHEAQAESVETNRNLGLYNHTIAKVVNFQNIAHAHGIK